MNYTLKVISPMGSTRRELSYDDKEEMFRDIEDMIVDNRRELNDKYGSEMKWDYSDTDSYVITNDEDDEVIETGMRFYDDGNVDPDKVATYVITHKTNGRKYQGCKLNEIVRKMYNENQIHTDTYSEMEDATDDEILDVLRSMPSDYKVEVVYL